MEYEITYEGYGTILNHNYWPQCAWSYEYHFEEEDFEILVEHFSGKTPDDDVSELVKQYLPDLNEEIEMFIVFDAQRETFFSGKMEDLVTHLERTGEYPIDIIENDIKKSRFNPGCKQWRQLPEKELIAQWCDAFRGEIENSSFINVSDFFEERGSRWSPFISATDYSVWFSQEIYDEIKRRKEASNKA